MRLEHPNCNDHQLLLSRFGNPFPEFRQFYYLSWRFVLEVLAFDIQFLLEPTYAAMRQPVKVQKY